MWFILPGNRGKRIYSELVQICLIQAFKGISVRSHNNNRGRIIANRNYWQCPLKPPYTNPTEGQLFQQTSKRTQPFTFNEPSPGTLRFPARLRKLCHSVETQKIFRRRLNGKL